MTVVVVATTGLEEETRGRQWTLSCQSFCGGDEDSGGLAIWANDTVEMWWSLEEEEEGVYNYQATKDR